MAPYTRGLSVSGRSLIVKVHLQEMPSPRPSAQHRLAEIQSELSTSPDWNWAGRWGSLITGLQMEIKSAAPESNVFSIKSFLGKWGDIFIYIKKLPSMAVLTCRLRWRKQDVSSRINGSVSIEVICKIKQCFIMIINISVHSFKLLIKPCLILLNFYAQSWL